MSRASSIRCLLTIPLHNTSKPARNKAVAVVDSNGQHETMLRPVIPWAVACLFTPLSGGQMSDVRSAWSYISGNLIAAAVKLPESDYSFRPTPDVRSFAQLVGHVADAQSAFCAPLLPQAKPRSGAEKLTGKADILDALKESVALCTAAADRVSDAQAAEHVKMFGQDRARLTVFWANIAHSNEHYGNVATYLRLKGVVPPSSEGALRSRVYFDQAHGQFGPQPEMAEIGARTGYQVVVQEQPITAEGLKNFRVLYLRAPSKAISPSEKDAIVGFVKGGGSLLLVVDEEQRQQLAVTGANDLIEPFGMKLTPDTPYLHNCGALAKAGEINAADREIPYSGGRAVEGGTPFAYQLDRDGKPAQAFAAWKKVDSGGRIIVLAEGMASIFLGKKEGQRLTGPPRDAMNTVYWGKDSVIFMEEVLAWLVKR